LAAALVLFGAALPQAVLAQAPDDKVPAVLADLATALSQGDAVAAIAAFHKSMKSYGSVSANIEALTAQFEILCAIDVVSESGTGDERTLDVDFFIQMKGRTGGNAERRRERVQLRLLKTRGRWFIADLSPPSILEPPSGH
jgi:hypothetical protein